MWVIEDNHKITTKLNLRNNGLVASIFTLKKSIYNLGEGV